MRQLFVCSDFKQHLAKSDTVVFEPVNSISNVMTASVSKKQLVAIKIVKQLDQDLMVRNTPSTFDESVTLADLMIKQVSDTLTLGNCIDLLYFADHYLIDELKINCLKFISLNIMSFFLEGSTYFEDMAALPLYLVRDLMNFIKLPTCEKFLWLDMTYFEVVHEYEQGAACKYFVDEDVTPEFCKMKFGQITNMFLDFEEGGRMNTDLKVEIEQMAKQLKQVIRKETKRRKSSQIDSATISSMNLDFDG